MYGLIQTLELLYDASPLSVGYYIGKFKNAGIKYKKRKYLLSQKSKKRLFFVRTQKWNVKNAIMRETNRSWDVK